MRPLHTVRHMFNEVDLLADVVRELCENNMKDKKFWRIELSAIWCNKIRKTMKDILVKRVHGFLKRSFLYTVSFDKAADSPFLKNFCRINIFRIS